MVLLGGTEVPDSVSAAIVAQWVPMVPISSMGSPTPSHQSVLIRTNPEGIVRWQSAAYKHISSAVFTSKEER